MKFKITKAELEKQLSEYLETSDVHLPMHPDTVTLEGESEKGHKCNTDTLKDLKHRARGLLYAIEDALKTTDG